MHYSTNNTATAAAGINHQINFQGKLVNPNGTNITDGTYSVVFSIYNVSTAGTAIWTETQSVGVTSGIFQVNLGSVTALPGTIDFNSDNIYLGVKVGADAEMTPRILFTSVPQAFNSEKLGGLDKNGFIQNGTTQQASTNFNIGGTGVVGTSLTTPLLQAAPATALTITGNAASTWSTSAGNLTLQAGSGTLSLNAGTIVGNAATQNLFNTIATTINFGGAASIMNIGPGSTTAATINLAGGNSATGCTVDGATGNFACSGTLSVGGAATTGNNLYVGNTSNQRVAINGGATNQGIDLGRTDSVASTPYFDFHSGTTGANDYDSRIIASGGTASSGGGTLTLQAATTAISTNATVGGTLTVTGQANLNGDVVIAGGLNVRGYVTSNTSSTASGQYTKLGSCTITSQYSDCHSIVSVVSVGDGNATGSRGTVDFRVKQQAALADAPSNGAPIVNLKVSDTNGNITASSFVAVTTANDATSTVVELYGQISSGYQQWRFTPQITAGSGVVPAWYNNQGFVATLPAGTQTTGANADITATTLNATTIQTGGTPRLTAAGVLQNVTNADASTFFTGGTLGVARGGTNATTIGAAGSIAYSTGSAYAFSSAGVANQCLLSGGSSAPVWGACSPTTGTSLMTLQGDTGTAEGVLTGDTITVAGGTNIATVSSATDTITINVVNNPSFSGLVSAQAGLSVNNAGITNAGAINGVTTLTASDAILTTSTVSGSQLLSTVATGTAPLQVISSTMVDNLNAQFIGGYTDSQISAFARANQMVTGGGTVGYNNPGTGISWSARFIVISNSRGADFGTNGYFDITMPADGTVITGANTPNITVAGGAIPLGTWCSLYYILPVGQTSTSLPANYRTVCYSGTNFSIPSNWLLIASHNADNGVVRFSNGLVLRSGQTGTAGTTNNVAFNTSVTTPLVQNAGTLNISATGANQVNLNTNGATRWSVLSTGELQGNGASTLKSSTGNITVASGGGNGDVVLAPNGTGNVNISVGGLKTNGTLRLSNTGALSNITGYAQSSGSATFNQNAADQFKIVALQAPTTDMLNISNAGFPITADGINGQQTDYYAALGNAAYQASAQRINITNTSATAGSITNGLRIVASGAVAGTTNGIKIDNFISGAGGASALNIGTGWKDLLNYNGTQLISGAGIVQSAAINGSYANLTGTGALTSGSIASGFGTISTSNTIQGTSINGTTGINTGASGGTQRIDASGNLVNIGNATLSGVITVTGFDKLKVSGLTSATVIAPDSTQIAQTPFGDSWHDIFAFTKAAVPTYETSDGTTWTAGTLNKNVFAGIESNTNVTFDGATTKAARYTWNTTAWSYAQISRAWLQIGFPYSNATAANKNITFETSADGVTWTTRHGSTNVTTQTAMMYGQVNGWANDSYFRLTVESTNSIPVNISTIRMYVDRNAGQGYGADLAYPYTADGDQNVRFNNSVNMVGNLSTNGTIRLTNGGVLQNVTNADAGTFFTGGSLPNARLQGGGALTINAGTGLSGGGSITLGSSATLNLANTAVVAGTYGSASSVGQFTVDAQGRITGASSVAITGLNSCSTCVSLQSTTPGTAQTGNFNITGSGILGGGLSTGGDITTKGNSLVATFVDSQAANLVANASFETNTTGWTSNAVTMARSTTEGYFGSSSLSMTYSGTGDAYAVYPLPNVPGGIAGRPYTFSFWAKSDVAGTSYGSLYLQGLTPTATLCSVGSINFTTTWQKYKVSCTIPAGTTSTSWRVVLRPLNNSAAATYFDGISVQYGTSATEYTPITVNDAGNVSLYDGSLGIGTATPGQKLDIQGGNINTSGNVMTGGTARLSSTGVLSNITGYTQTSGSTTFNQNAADQLKVVALQAPTTDMVNVSNAGFPITADGINGQQIDYYSALGTSTFQASAQRLNVTNTSAVAGSITNGLRIVASGAVAGTTNGIKIDGFVSGAGGASALNIGTGWKDILNYNGTQLINGTGVIQSAAVSGNYGNLTGTGALTSGSIASGFGTISTANTIQGTSINGTTGINTGASGGTQRIDASGNLLNIGNIISTGVVGGKNILPYQFSSWEYGANGDNVPVYGSNAGQLSGVTISTAGSYDGTRSLQMTTNTTGADAYAYISPNATIPVRPNTKYALSAYVKDVTGAGSTSSVEFFVRQNNSGATHAAASGTAIDTGWTRISGTFTTAADTTALGLRTDINAPSRSVLFDAFMLEEIPSTQTTASGFSPNNALPGISLSSGTTNMTFDGSINTVGGLQVGGLPVITSSRILQNVTNANADTFFTAGQIPNARLTGGGALTVTPGTGLSGGGSIALGGSATFNLANTTVVAGTYGSATTVGQFTVDAQGRITSATNVALSATCSTCVNLQSTAPGTAQTGNINVTGTIRGGSLAVGPAANQQVSISGGAGNHGIDIGRTDNTTSTPFIDFHSGATGTNDYDSRIIASGGTASNGGGTLTIQSASAAVTGSLAVTGAVTANSTALFKNSSDGTAAFQVQNANGVSLMNVSTSGNSVSINQAALNVTGLPGGSAVPSAPTISSGASTGGTIAGGARYYYRVTSTAGSGESAPSGETSYVNNNRLSPPATALTATPLNNGTYTHYSCFSVTYKYTYVTATGETIGGAVSSEASTGDDIQLSNISVGPSGTIARRIYATCPSNTQIPVDNGYYLIGTLNNNTATTYTDTSAAVNGGNGEPLVNTAVSQTNVNTVSWPSVAGAVSYKVYRGTSQGAENILVGTTSSTTLSDTGAGSAAVMPSVISTPSLQVAGGATIQTGQNTGSAFTIQNAAGDALLNADTINQRVSIGSVTNTDARLTVTAPVNTAPTWTMRTAAAALNWVSIAYGNGTFVAVPASGSLMTSSDGISWVSRTSPLTNFTAVTFGNGLFVAVSGGYIITSSDGVTWTTRLTNSGALLQSVAYGGGSYVAVGSLFTGQEPQIFRSTDGVNWTTGSAPQPVASWSSVTYGNGTFVAVSQATGSVATSINGGQTWTTRTASEALQWTAVTYGNGLFVAVAQTGTNRVMTSPDGINWTSRVPTEQNTWYGITYGNGVFVAVARDGVNRVMTSTDGINWSPSDGGTPGTTKWQSVAYGNGTFVAVAYLGSGSSLVMTATAGYATALRTVGTIDNQGDLKVAGNSSVAGVLSINGATNPLNARVAIQMNAGIGENGLYINALNANGGANIITDIVAANSQTSYFLYARSGNGSDLEFTVRGDGTVRADGAFYGASYNSGSADVAEYVPSNEAANIEAGDILEVDGTSDTSLVKKSTGVPYASKLAGIVSTQPGVTLGDTQFDNDGVADHSKEVRIALTGRVPVKVTNENGAIKPGDYITSSSTPGYGMKATQAGMTVGRALASFDSEKGTVLVLTENSYYNPSVANMLQAGNDASFNDLTVKGTADIANLNVSGNTMLQNLTVKGDATIEGKLTVASIDVGTITISGHLVTKGDTPQLSALTALGAKGSISIDGNDTAGTITITTGDTGLTAGDLGKISFKNAFSKTPKIILSAQDQLSQSAEIFPSNKTTGDFTLKTGLVLPAHSTYIFDYITIE